MSIVTTKEDIYEIMACFEKSSCNQIEIKENGLSVKLTKGCIKKDEIISDASDAIYHDEGEGIDNEKLNKSIGEKVEGNIGNETVQIKSPIVGVFYASPKPDEAPYVEEGQKVKKGDVLCLVEAMKMMNELKSPVDGVVKKIYGENGKLTEFDEVLFEVLEC